MTEVRRATRDLVCWRVSREGELEDQPEHKDVMEAWRQVVAGISASCQPTNAVAKVRRCDPLYLAFLCTLRAGKKRKDWSVESDTLRAGKT